MEIKKKKLGVIGCGNIGNEIAMAIDKGDINVTLHACFDTDRKKYDSIISKYRNIKPVFMEVEDLIKSCDLVVECAVKSAVRGFFELAIKHSRDIMFLSAGGVIDCMDLIEEAKKKNINLRAFRGGGRHRRPGRGHVQRIKGCYAHYQETSAGFQGQQMAGGKKDRPGTDIYRDCRI
jgi:ketol-acid reductoisomerase